MAKRLTVNIGDVFEVRTKNNKVGYFQFIGLDFTQLNSEVIRIFNQVYELGLEPKLDEIVIDKVKCNTHISIKLGYKMNLWDKIGNVALEESFESPYFRDTLDILNNEIKISKNWRVWRMNESFKDVGMLNEEQKTYDIGPIRAPIEIPEIIEKGESGYFYPQYE